MNRTEAPYRDAARYDAEMARAYAEQDSLEDAVLAEVLEMAADPKALADDPFANIGLGHPLGDTAVLLFSDLFASMVRNQSLPREHYTVICALLIPAATNRVNERRSAAREAA